MDCCGIFTGCGSLSNAMQIKEIFKLPHPLIPKAGRTLQNWVGVQAYHEEYGVRHPLSAYNVSILSIAKRTNAVLDLLDDTALFRGQSSNRSNWEDRLLEAMDHLLDTLNEHVEDCGGVLRSFFPKDDNLAFNVALKQFKKKTKPYRGHICKVDNFIKHNQGRLRLVMMENEVATVPGYYVEGPIPGGGLGASPEIHGSTHTAYSFNRDIPFHICNIYAMSACLADALRGVNTKLVPKDVGENGLGDVAWVKMLTRVAKLPHIYFPDEVTKSVPLIKFSETNVRIEYPAAIARARMLVGEIHVSTSHIIDSVTPKAHLPYLATKPMEQMIDQAMWSA